MKARLLAVACFVALASSTVAVLDQRAAAQVGASPSSWMPALTPDGHPDLEGVWSDNTVTPFERPKELADRSMLSETEVGLLKSRAARLFALDGDVAAGDELFLALLRDPSEFKNPDTFGSFNQVWAGEELTFDNRTSQIVDPSTGLLPPLTPDAEQKQTAFAVARRLQPADGPESRTLLERCITNGPIRVGIVQSRNDSYYQVFQTREYVALSNDVMHETRIIPLDNQPVSPGPAGPWLGTSRWHWDATTLVIDTTNFSSQSRYRPTRQMIVSAEHFRVAERLTPVDAETIRYEVTVDDPITWTKPWTAVTYWKRSNRQIYEFACHEGNYALPNILRGARAEDRATGAVGQR